jgi:hypothetical protein
MMKEMTKTAKSKRASLILNAHEQGQLLGGEEFEFMRAIFSNDPRHPNANVKAIKVAHAPKGRGSQNLCFYVLVDDEWTEWSFLKALGIKK